MPTFSSVQPIFAGFAGEWRPGQPCALCGRDEGPQLVCEPCERSLPRAAAHPDCVAAFDYAFPVDRLVQRFKFAGDLALGRWLAGRLAERARPEARPELLVAPPLARARLRERGFNQAHELAKAVGGLLGVPVAGRGLARRRATVPQPGLGRGARLQNLEGAFECRMDLSGCRIAVVDDVMTTGATVQALGAALRSAGAASVRAWVVARTPEPGG